MYAMNIPRHFYKLNNIDLEVEFAYNVDSRKFVYHFDDINFNRRSFTNHYRNMIYGGDSNNFVSILPKNLNIIIF